MICAIHQPNFFPWLGYFDKLSRVDAFVLLNQVDYEKSGHSMQCYTNRVGILKNGKSSWIHCPVVREHGAQSICDVRINNKTAWRNELKNTLRECYKSAAYYNDVAEYIFSLISFETNYLSEYNIHIIEELVKHLDLKAKLFRQDQFQTTLHSTELLIELVKAVDCDCYLFGGGGTKYQQDELFEKQGIKLIGQNFQFPHYEQVSQPFVPGVSILDTLFNCGFDGTKYILNANKQQLKTQ